MKYGGFDEDVPMRDYDRRDRGPPEREWKRRGGSLDISPPHKKRRSSHYGDYERDDYERDYRKSSERRSHSQEREDRERRTERRLFDGPLLPIQRFALEIRGEDYPPEKLEKKYEEYIAEHQNRSAKRFYEEHREDEWFKERYHPDYVKELLEERTAYCRKQADLFAELMAEGKISLSLDHKPNSHEAEKESEKSPKKGGEEDTEMGSDKAAEKNDEADVDADKGEDSGEGEDDDEDEDEDDDDDTKPRDENDSIEKDAAPDASSDTAPKGKARRFRKMNTVFLRSIPVSVSRKALLEILDKDDHRLEYLILAQPRHTNFDRVAWAHYKDEDVASKACEAVNGVEVDDYRVVAQLKMERGVFRKVAPPATATPERLEHDREKALLLAQQMDKEKEINSATLERLLEQRATVKEKVDLAIAYLRKVHLFCYYCGEGFADLDMMRDRCGTIHVRAPRLSSAGEPDAQEKEWLESLDKRNTLRIEDPPNLEVPSSEEIVEKAASEFLEKHTKEEGGDKFRCGISYCAKLFCGKQFVTTHLNLKHGDELATVKEKAVEAVILENFKEDPPRPKAPPQNAPRAPPPGPFPPGPYHPGPFPPGPFGRGRPMGPPPGFGPPPFARSPMAMNAAMPMAPPPGMSPDPRQIRQYIDLDAPVEAVPEIDYRASVSYDDV